ncbi:MAG: hypothetical protein ACREMR_10920, partial [Gemmatimonadales bacterium]
AWNSDAALALAGRAALRRTAAQRDSGLQDYTAKAHGFVFFLGQFGEGLHEPPKLVKADQLELEVYWKAPRLSKQRIVGWRDRTELPTDIHYHTDHLGIVQNNFGSVIRLGDGDEVRDVVHPLVPGGSRLYDYALGDTLVIALPQREVRVVALAVRPRDFGRASLVGTIYVDAETADLVRMTFNFTPAAYVDPQLEDVSIVLDNAVWDGRFWLPYRQEIEIRRRATWLDIPVRGIIRGRWEIGDYTFNVGLADALFASGPEIEALPPARRDSFPWAIPLDLAIRDFAEPLREDELERVRDEVRSIAGRQVLSGLQPVRLGARGVSDLIHANRVEGVTPGAGVVWRPGGTGLALRVHASYGFADERVKARVEATHAGGVDASVSRRVRDVLDEPIIAPLVNSFTSQELGDDYGDYYLVDAARLGVRRGLGARGEWSVAIARERVRSLSVQASPATGVFRANPALGDVDASTVQIGLRRKSGGVAVRRDLWIDLTAEAGWVDEGASYLRVAAAGHLLLPAGGTAVSLRARAGVAGDGLPRHRAFVLGGRGTLLGDDFRRWGGRRALLLHGEWRIPVRLPVSVGPYPTVAAPVTIAPHVAAGRSDRPITGTPWAATPAWRTTLGVGLELLGVFRLEAGLGLQSRRVRFAFDV